MNEQYIRALVQFTRAASPNVLLATIDHLAHGNTQSEAAKRHNVKQEAIARLSKRIKELDKQVTRTYELKSTLEE